MLFGYVSNIKLKNSKEQWESNPGQLVERRGCNLCAKPSPPLITVVLLLKEALGFYLADGAAHEVASEMLQEQIAPQFS